VTGIGHEIDTTIADLVADVRAKTPTDAANVVVPDREGLVNTLTDARDRLAILADRALSFLESDLDTLEARLAARGPRAALAKHDVEVSALGPRLRAAARERIERAATELERLRSRLRTSSPLAVLAERRRRFDLLAAAIRAAIDARLAAGQQRLEVGAARLAGVSPVAILGRGYSLTRRTGDAGFLRSAEGLHVGDAVETRLARGAFRSRVERVETEAQES
jgi:exodeoxyribonuclease VII large subunit